MKPLKVCMAAAVIAGAFSLGKLQLSLTRPVCEPGVVLATAPAPEGARPVDAIQVTPPQLTPATCVGPRLILHVGPHKTGTTTFQEFLVSHAAWLQDTLGVTVGFNQAKEGAGKLNHIMMKFRHLKGPQWTKDAMKGRLQAAVEYTKMQLQSSSLVLVSAEGFSQFDDDMWTFFKSLFVDKVCFSAVVLHRDPTIWIASMWNQISKMNSNNLQDWNSFLADTAGNSAPDEHGETDLQLKLLNTLTAHFPQAVDAVSYDYLHEVNCSVAVYVLCNATLRRTDQSWKDCKNALDRKLTKNKNKSPPHAAVDVTMLARAFYLAKQAMNATQCTKPWPDFAPDSAGAVIPSEASVIEVAKHMPVKCERMDGLFQVATDTWFARTAAQKPTSDSRKPVCSVDVGRLEPEHWRLIGKLVRDCY